MDPINLLRLGQVIQQDMLDRAALDRLEWTPQPWVLWISAALKRTWQILTRADRAAQRRVTPAQHPVGERVTAPDISTECC